MLRNDNPKGTNGTKVGNLQMAADQRNQGQDIGPGRIWTCAALHVSQESVVQHTTSPLTLES